MLPSPSVRPISCQTAGDKVSELSSAAVRKAALRKLFMLDAASSLLDLRSPPANRLEKLRGDREGKYSIRINAQWRICFEWHDSSSWNVEIVDYH